MSESQIKRQYHNTVRIQQKQYKALQKQMIATVPKERHREVLRQTKEEQMRKIAMLALQYERTIADMAQKQTVSDMKCQLQCTVYTTLYSANLTQIDFLIHLSGPQPTVLPTYGNMIGGRGGGICHPCPPLNKLLCKNCTFPFILNTITSLRFPFILNATSLTGEN